MLAAGAAGASLPPPTAPPTGPGAGGPFPVGHRLGPGGHGAQSLQAQRRSDLGAGAAHGPCGSLGRKGRPGRAGSRPQHPQPQPPPWELALQLANQPCPSRLVSAALSGPTPGAGCRGVCVGGQQVLSSEKPPVLTPWGDGASQRSRMRASHAQTPRGSAARRAASPLHVTPGRPVQSKGHPGVSGSGPPSVAVTEQSALGVSPPPRPIAQEARPSPHGPQSAWQLLSSHWKGWGGTVGGAWSCPSRAHCAPPPGEQRGPVLSQCLRAPS